MAFTSPNMLLTVWNLVTDLFDHTALANNFDAVDAHDHSSGKGVQITTAGIANAAVTGAKIASNTITSTNLASGSITSGSIAAGSITGSEIAAATVTASNLAAGATATAFSVTAPVSPVDGQIWYYSVNSSGLVWQFRYNLGSSSAHKWEFVGGSVVLSNGGGYTGGVQTTVTPLSGSSPFTLPFAGDYALGLNVGIWEMPSNSGAAAYLTVGGSQVLTLGASAITTSSLITISGLSVAGDTVGAAASAVVATSFNTGVVSGSYVCNTVTFSVLPIRVG